MLDKSELNRRANEVFLMDENEIVEDVRGTIDDVRVTIHNRKTDERWDYIPNMSERPQALDYLLGKRDDFND